MSSSEFEHSKADDIDATQAFDINWAEFDEDDAQVIHEAVKEGEIPLTAGELWGKLEWERLGLERSGQVVPPALLSQIDFYKNESERELLAKQRAQTASRQGWLRRFFG